MVEIEANASVRGLHSMNCSTKVVSDGKCARIRTSSLIRRYIKVDRSTCGTAFDVSQPR